MKPLDNEILTESKRPAAVNNKFFKIHLYKNSFRGFWYDAYEKSYGIKLSFMGNNSGLLNLYAQDAEGNMVVFEYRIKSNAINIDQISYDKVLISTSEYDKELIEPQAGSLKVPPYIEFTLQLLSHNSVYIQFTDYSLYSPPINKLRRGLVLAREHNL
ncbi:hypothetical protein ES705_10622 [subsurface metagenome]